MNKPKYKVEREGYEEKVIIYLDILGIGNFTEERADEKLIEIYQKLENLYNRITVEKIINTYGLFNIDISPERLKFHFSILSDTIIISFSKKYLLILPMILRIPRALQLLLLQKGLLTKGVVIFDKIYHKNNSEVIFGKGLVRSYKMEKNLSLPQIVIEDKLWKMYEGDIKKLPNSLKTKLNATDNLEMLHSYVNCKKDFFKQGDQIVYNHYNDARHVIEELLKSDVEFFSAIINKSIESQKEKLKKRNLESKAKGELERRVRYWEYAKEMFDKYVVK